LYNAPRLEIGDAEPFVWVVRDRAGQPVAVGQVDDEQQMNADAGWLDSMHDPIARRRRPGLYPEVLGAIRVLIRKAGSAAESEAGPPEVWSPAPSSRGIVTGE
jgi:hypothetical protein